MSICLVRFCAVGVKFVLLRVGNNIDSLVVIYSIPKIYRLSGNIQ